MSRLQWNASGQRFFETGVDHGVLYPQQDGGAFNMGYAWNGLTTVTESPSGAEASPQYADNMKWINLVSAEEFGGTIEAFTYPDAFAECDGTAVVSGGLFIDQQTRKTFGFSYRTLKGNDQNPDLGYKIHLVYGCLAAPSEKSRTTVNDSPEATPFSWEVTTTAVQIGTVGGKTYKPTSHISVDSTKFTAAQMQALEDILYGTEGVDPRLPMPAEVIGLFTGSQTTVVPTEPTFNATTGDVTIPTVTGVVYQVDGETVTGTYTVPAGESRIVTAVPDSGYRFPANTDDDWQYTRA
jgi:hypothetical protein